MADMNEQVMYWLAPASNRPEISDPMMRIVRDKGIAGGIWMLHNYWKQAWFEGRFADLSVRRIVPYMRIADKAEVSLGPAECPMATASQHTDWHTRKQPDGHIPQTYQRQLSRCWVLFSRVQVLPPV